MVFFPNFLRTLPDLLFGGLRHGFSLGGLSAAPSNWGVQEVKAVPPRLLLDAAWRTNVEVSTLFLFSFGRFE
jgi:hypothetical protein